MSNLVYLAHHGIKGQKWGVRRWQYKDGSLTPEGYQHYYGNNPNARMTRFGVVDSKTGKMLYSNPTRQQRKDNKAQYRSEMNARYGIEKKKQAYQNAISKQKEAENEYYNTGDINKYNKSVKNTQYAKRELADAKSYASFKEQSKQSKRQTSLIEQYKSKGLTQKEAEIAAYKRDRAEKIATAVLATAAVTAVAYGAYRYADYSMDKTLNTNTVLSRVTKELQEGGNKGVYDAFYAVKDKSAHDKARYAGLYAKQMRSGVYGYVAPKVYEKKIGVDSAIKVASRKSAKEVLSKELSKGNNLQIVERELNLLGGGRLMSPSVRKDIESFRKTGKIGGSLYDAINRQLVARETETTKMFYGALKEAGYGAVKDVNDAKYSGFRTKLPLIVFDSKNVSVKKVTALKDSDIIKQANRVVAENSANATMKRMALYGSIGALSSLSIAAASKAQDDRIVREYREEHPNSKLSYNAILRNYNG